MLDRKSQHELILSRLNKEVEQTTTIKNAVQPFFMEIGEQQVKRQKELDYHRVTIRLDALQALTQQLRPERTKSEGEPDVR